MLKKTMLVLALAAGAAEAKPFKIAALLPLSGSQSYFGNQVVSGASMALQESRAYFKRAYDIDLSLTEFDDRGLPYQATSNAKRLIKDRNIYAVIGSINSGATQAAATVFAPENISMITPNATANNLTAQKFPNVQRMVASDALQAPVAAEFIANTLKARTVYIINDKTSVGETLAETLKINLERSGVKVLGYEGTRDRTNFQSFVIKLKVFKPDVIFFGGVYEQGAYLIKQLRDAGVAADFVGTSGLDSEDYSRIGGAATVGTYFVTGIGPVSAYPNSQEFVKEFRSNYRQDPHGLAMYGYDATKVYLRALERCIKAYGLEKGEVPTREQLMKMVREINALDLLSGDIRFNSAGDRVFSQLFMMQVQPNFQPKVVSTTSLKNPQL
ncbi:branched-chain amino acid ABC transporter substrate-binding protein [Deinococcus misasensis]|uniref:branched-chain amino acid ABC transporter substrate-binding protein n=1 Tax=Deinococcus misasensis TaxID=392413 RepID=UPI00068955B6|nr:branched-chain amino acid ABC transporter substrate-binding protein [Deinococcus misasensis]